jgi:PhnB protein
LLCLVIKDRIRHRIAIYKRALEAGVTFIMQPTDQFYGDRSASIKDQFGNIWYVATHIEDLSNEELTKRMDEFMKKRKQEQI